MIFFAALLLCTVGFARPVSQQKAEDIALKFLGLQPMTKGASPLHLIWTGEPMTKVGDGDPALYVFKRDSGGFVIIAGDDCLRPVLGYSDDSEFIVENMPENISGWFSSLTKMVSQARKNGLNQSKIVSNEWQSVPTKSSSGVTLYTALWNQLSPYNLYTPMLRSNGTERCNTGCTNTATAIVMRYYEYPEAGVGTLPDYTYTKGGTTRTQPGHKLGHKYDWDNMPKSNLNASTPTYQAEQVARLMYDCGVMNKCMWTQYVADTNPKNIPLGLTTYMGYDKAIRILQRDGFTTEEWEGMIREELNHHRPVIYDGGRSDGNGHAWVVDGYNDNGYFMMNWGWGGSANGFYLISPLNEAGMGYTERHEMIIGIKPNNWDEPYSEPDYEPIRLTEHATSDWKFDVNRQFTTFFFVENLDYLSHTIECKVALVDRNGKLKEFISEPGSIDVSANGIASVKSNCRMTLMPEADDQIVLFYLQNGEWKPMEYTDENVIKMKGPSAIEDCTTVTYSKITRNIVVRTERDNAILFYYTDSGGQHYYNLSVQNIGTNSINIATLPTSSGDGNSQSVLNVRVCNIAESKEFRLLY